MAYFSLTVRRTIYVCIMITFQSNAHRSTKEKETSPFVLYASIQGVKNRKLTQFLFFNP